MAAQRESHDETIRVLLERSSVRNFAEKKVPSEVLMRVLEAGTHAPTGGNLQPYSIIKIEEPQTRHKLAELAGGQAFVAKAPISLLFCIDWYRLARWAEAEKAPFTATSSFRHFWISFQDTVICAQSVCVAAESLGLGTVYVGTIMDNFREVRRLCRLPKEVFPVVLVCMGYPASRPEPAHKLGIDVVVHDETYQRLEEIELLDAFDEKYQGRQREITDDRLRTIEQVCREVRGEQFAQQCLERIRENGFISPVQAYFGLHYRANALPRDNEDYLKMMEESGFSWFRQYEPPGEQSS